MNYKDRGQHAHEAGGTGLAGWGAGVPARKARPRRNAGTLACQPRSGSNPFATADIRPEEPALQAGEINFKLTQYRC